MWWEPCRSTLLLMLLVSTVPSSAVRNASSLLQLSHRLANKHVVEIQTASVNHCRGAQEDIRKPCRSDADALRLGVLFTFTDAQFLQQASYGNASIELARHWANRHNYEVFIEEYFDTSRDATWSRVPMIKKHLPKVDVLMYLDLDVFIADMGRSAEKLLPKQRSSCNMSGQPQFDMELGKGNDEIFAWFGRGYMDHYDGSEVMDWPESAQGVVPLCAGAMALRNTPRAFELLDQTWRLFDRLPEARKWPFEQFAFGHIFANNQEYLKRLCVLPQDQFAWNGLEASENAMIHESPFMFHASGPTPENLSKEQRRSELASGICKRVSQDEGVYLTCSR